MTAGPTSYDAGAYADLRRVVDAGGRAALAALALLALVAVAITSSAIRAAVIARSEDLALMRLLGAAGPVPYGPFAVEGAMTGAAAGAVAAAVLTGLFAGVERASAGAFTALLPGVGWDTALAAAAVLPAAGVALGLVGALLGLRRRGT